MRTAPGAEYYFEEGCYITELSNTAADEAVSIARARLQPGEKTRLHALLETAERYVILAGSGKVRVGEQQGPVDVGDVVLIPPGVPQNIEADADAELVFLAICSPRFKPGVYRDLEPK